jgi:hypothetical protein
MKYFWKRILSLSLATLLAYAPVSVFAQGYSLPANTTAQGHLIAQQPEAPPTGVGCTIAAGSTDLSGTCATTAASGSITFTSKRPDGTVGFVVAPTCLITDATATSTVSMPVYTVSATAITLSTIITAHTLHWLCMAKTGG